MKLVVGLCGASGIIFGIRLLEMLDKNHKDTVEVHLIATDAALEVMAYETEYTPKELKAMAAHFYRNDEMAAKPASGSFRFDAMVIIPSSLSTVGKVASGIADNLLTRTAHVCLKERRRLVLVPRETPLSLINLRNLATLSEAGAVILPPMPAFYNKPQSLDDIIDFVAGRALDLLGIDNNAYKRWNGL